MNDQEKIQIEKSEKINLRIIIIDDNPEVHEDFIKTLTVTQLDTPTNLEEEIFGSASSDQVVSLPNFQISSASQGQEGVKAIEQALKEGNPYALAFVDIRMPPGWDGIETIKHIWKLDNDIQIVICTAYSDYSWDETIQKLGEKDNLLILKKPFDTVAVRQLACSLTKKWQLLQDIHRYTNALEEGIKERTESLKKSMSIIRATFESSTDGILVIDNSGMIIDHNDKLIEMFNLSPSILETKQFRSIAEYISNQLDDSTNDLQKKIDSILHKKTQIIAGKLIFKDGKIFEYFSVPHKVDENISGNVWSFRDITQQTMLEDKLQYQALHDPLTGLINRAGLLNFIRREISASNKNNTLFGLFFIDLDRFKLINDSISHEVGDELLCIVAKRLQAALRSQDTISRLGGDEFVALVPNIEDKKYLADIANKIIIAMNEPAIIATIRVTVTASIGISFFPADSKTADNLLRNADIAMYHAKNMGGNKYVYFSEELNNETIARFEKIIELRAALENKEFFLQYQPQFDTLTDKLVAVEALVRWRHPEKGIILPMDFIPLAEETGIIVELSDWILREACRQNKDWQNRNFPPIRMAVNIFACQFTQINFASNIVAILKEVNLDPKFLEIELTENLIINNIDNLTSIQKLKNIGIKITLDDFGAGYSNFSYLNNISLDRLKINKSLIDDISDQRNDQLVVKAIIAMAKNMSLEVVSEGIDEKKTQLESLKKLEFEEMQGFYFSKPQSVEDLEKLFMP